MILIIDQLAKARQIWDLLVKVPIDDETLYRLVAISGLEDFELACQQANTHRRACGRVPQNINRWMKDQIHIKRANRAKKQAGAA